MSDTPKTQKELDQVAEKAFADLVGHMAKCEAEDRAIAHHVEWGKSLGLVPLDAEPNRATLGEALRKHNAAGLTLIEDRMNVPGGAPCPYRRRSVMGINYCPCPLKHGGCELGPEMKDEDTP